MLTLKGRLHNTFKRVGISRLIGLLSLLFVLSIGQVKAQPIVFGNEWINYNQTYFRINVLQQGLYRLTPAAMRQVGIPVEAIGRNQYQVFRRGRQVPILVSGSGNTPLTDQDAIEFYGEPNDGANDSALYVRRGLQMHRLAGAYSDTGVYFLTWVSGTTTPSLRMPVFGENRTDVTFRTWHQAIEQQIYRNRFYVGRGYLDANGSMIQHSYFDRGTGWMSNEIQRNQDLTFTFTNLSNLASGTGQNPTAELLVTGVNARRHRAIFFAGTSTANLTRVGDTLDFQGFESRLRQIPLQPAWLNAGTVVVRMRVVGFDLNVADRQAIAFGRIRYPQTLDFATRGSTQQLYIPPTGEDYIRLQLNNIGAARLIDISNPLSPRQIQTFAQNPTQSLAGINNTLNGRLLYIVSTPQLVTGGNIRRVQFRNIQPARHNYLIVTNRFLMRPSEGSPNPVRDYADYRASMQGGRFDTLVVEQDLLDNQFNYGERSPVSTRNFCAFMVTNGRPRHLFLLGKGRHIDERGTNDFNFTNLVYAFGKPASDILFTAGLTQPSIVPEIPTGRLAVTTGAQIVHYLEKVKVTEQLGFNQLWRKNFLNLTGGRLGETEVFKQFGEDYSRLLEAPLAGGKATLISRRSSSIIEAIDISAKVNEGISMINIFGHSSVAGADIDIGNCTEPSFTTAGRYPLIILNGCYAGNLYTSGVFSLNENWVLTRNRGAIAFIGNVDFGLPSFLNRYVRLYISTQFEDSTFFSRPVGEVQRELIRRYTIGTNLSVFDTILNDQFTLHGDPAVTIFGAPRADYATSNNEIFLADRNISASSNTIRVGVAASNFGRAPRDSMVVRWRRILPDGREIIYPVQTSKPLFYHDTLYYDFPKPEGNASGLNRFEAVLNFFQTVPEIRRDNNTAVLEIVVPESGITPLFPPVYGIVNQGTVSLSAQANNLLTDRRTYRFELDTARNFNSPLRRTASFEAGNLATWRTTLPLQRDSMVYFWRVRFGDVRATSDTTWHNGSFTYIGNGAEGWSQGNFGQFDEIRLSNLVRQVPQRQFDFPFNQVDFRFFAGGGSTRTSNATVNGLSIFDNTSGFGCLGDPGEQRLLVLAIDRNTLQPKPWPDDAFEPQFYWRYQCGRDPMAFNRMNPDRVFRFFGLYGMVISPMYQTGDYFVVYSTGNFPWERYRDGNFLIGLARIGVDTTEFKEKIRNGHPFIAFGRKDFGVAQTRYADLSSGTSPQNQTLTFDLNLRIKATVGQMISPRIGPARQWSQLSYRFDGSGNRASEKTKIQLWGSDLQGNETLLVEEVDRNPYPLSGINANQYPYLSLRAQVSDSTDLPPQLKRWTVLYQGVPEATINPELTGVQQFTIPAMQEGQTFNLKAAFQNISSRTFQDSLEARVTIRNINSGQLRTIPTRKFKPLAVDDSITLNLNNVSTVGLGGSNLLQIFFNPLLQPELNYNNNNIEIPFVVNPDRSNPVLEVTFDGQRIMDGEIVSPSPLILTTLRDNNPYLPKRDTVGLFISLKRPCESCVPERISFADPNLRFTPATETSPLRIEYNPKNLEDGKYQLRVQGEDASGNKSGAFDYQISFEVINQSTISHFFPYPNPFSSSTRFVFTLTGADIPDDLKIQIMTVSGKVVREVLKEELGPIRIGQNISTFAWNGTDEFGDRLGNGVYLYRVLVRSRGQNIEHRSTSADDTFKNGFGKLYLMR